MERETEEFHLQSKQVQKSVNVVVVSDKYTKRRYKKTSRTTFSSYNRIRCVTFRVYFRVSENLFLARANAQLYASLFPNASADMFLWGVKATIIVHYTDGIMLDIAVLVILAVAFILTGVNATWWRE